MSNALILRYSEGLVDAGEMDSYDAADNIIAFTEFMGVCALAAYGDKAKLKTSVRGIAPGSFVIQFGIDVVGIGATLLTGPADFKSLIDLFKGAIELLKHLGGVGPSQVVRHGDEVNITNNNGIVQIFKGNVSLILQHPNAASAAQRFIRHPLKKSAAKLTIEEENKTPIIEIGKDEADAFVPFDSSDIVSEGVITKSLEIIKPDFHGGKWQFYDGEITFWASIEDGEFLGQVDSGEQ